MRMTCIPTWHIAVLCLALLSLNAHARDIYVSTNGNDTAADSWSSAYTDVQTALDAAGPADTIYVAGHEFAVTNALSWTDSRITMRGGYPATNATGPGACDPDLWPSVITRDPSYQTRLLDIEAVSNAVIENMTFLEGYLINTAYAGGVYASSVTNLALRSCRFVDNYVSGAWGDSSHGGGLVALDTTGVITNCLFKGNYANGGGYRSGCGGGAYVSGGSLDFADCRFFVNQGFSGRSNSGLGAACYIASGTHRMRNVLAALNRALHWTSGLQGAGGGFYINNTAQVVIENATIYGNEPDGIYNKSVDTVISNSIVYANTTVDINGSVTPSLSHCCIGDGTGVGSNGNLGGDPEFAEEWFYLASDSPCVDAGSGTPADAGLDGRTTQTNGTADTGDVDFGYHYTAGVEPFDVLYVSPDGDDDENGGTGWGDAFATITHALETAGDRARIYLDSGQYDKTGEAFPLTIQERTAQFIGTNAETTVIDASGAGNSVFNIDRSLGPNRIIGVTVRGGSDVSNGGGIWINDSLLFADACDIVENGANYGGGVYAEQSSITLSVCDVLDNTAYGGWKSVGCGGGIYTKDSIAVVNNSRFAGNLARGNTGGAIGAGGGAYFFRSGATLSQCILTNNTAKYGTSVNSAYGGGVYLYLGTSVLRNLLVAGNTALAGDSALPHGSGIYAAAGNVTLESSTIVTNVGGGALDGGGASVTVLNAFLCGNVGGNISNLAVTAFSYCCAPELTNGVGNITNTPVFIDADAQDYRLTESSPGINGGQTVAWMLLSEATDLAGEPRVLNSQVDMGAYETFLPPAGTIIKIQ